MIERLVNRDGPLGESQVRRTPRLMLSGALFAFSALIVAALIISGTTFLTNPSRSWHQSPIEATVAVPGQLGSVVPVGGHIGGTYAAVAASGAFVLLGVANTLEIVDASDPDHPVTRGVTSALPHDILDISATDRYAFVAQADGYLSVIDWSDVFRPSITSNVAIEQDIVALGLTGSNDQLVMLVHPKGGERNAALVISTLPPNDPFREVARLNLGSEALDLRIAANTAFVAVPNGLITIDLPLTGRPAILGNLTVSGSRIAGLAVAEQRAYLLGQCETVGCRQPLWVVDTSIPSAPRVVAEHDMVIDSLGAATGILAVGQRLYGMYPACDLDRCSLLLIGSDQSTPHEPRPLEALSLEVSAAAAARGDLDSGIISDVLPASGRAYLLVPPGLFIANLSGAAGPRPGGELPIVGDVLRVDAVAGRAYVADGSRYLQFLETSGAGSSWLHGSLRVDEHCTTCRSVAQDVSVSPDRVSVAVSDGGLFVATVNPDGVGHKLGLATIAGDARRLTASGDHAFVIGWMDEPRSTFPSRQILALMVFDITGDGRPRMVGWTELDLGHDAPGIDFLRDLVDIAVAQGIAYVAAKDHGVLEIDVRDPTAPRQLPTPLVKGSATSVAVSDAGLAFVALVTCVADRCDSRVETLNQTDTGMAAGRPVLIVAGSITAIAQSGDALYAGVDDQVVSIQLDGRAPGTLTARHVGGDVLDLDAVGSTLYVAAGRAGLFWWPVTASRSIYLPILHAD